VGHKATGVPGCTHAHALTHTHAHALTCTRARAHGQARAHTHARRRRHARIDAREHTQTHKHTTACMHAHSLARTHEVISPVPAPRPAGYARRRRGPRRAGPTTPTPSPPPSARSPSRLSSFRRRPRRPPLKGCTCWCAGPGQTGGGDGGLTIKPRMRGIGEGRGLGV
jgi:hypothetical protein